MASHPCSNIYLFRLFGCFLWLTFTMTHAREKRVFQNNYEHLSLEEGHLALDGLESLEKVVKDELGFSEQDSLDQKRKNRGVIGGIAIENEMEDLLEKGPQVLTMSTESPKSRIFFQVIQTTEPSQRESGGIHTRGDNNYLVKASGSDAESTKANNSIENFTLTAPMQHTGNPFKGLVANSDGTWKTGYPGHLDNEEEGDKAGDSTAGDLEEQSQEWNMEDTPPQTSKDTVFNNPTHIMEWNAKEHEDEVDTPEEAVLDLHNEWTKPPPKFSKKVIETPPTTLSLDPHLSATTPILVTMFYKGYTGRNWTKPTPETKPQTTKELCKDDQGHLVTIVLIAISAVMVAVVVTVWCYKKMQQKKCVHEISAEGQSRPVQHVEMEQKI